MELYREEVVLSNADTAEVDLVTLVRTALL